MPEEEQENTNKKVESVDEWGKWYKICPIYLIECPKLDQCEDAKNF